MTPDTETPTLQGYGLVSREELAKILGRNPRTLYRWELLGTGPPITRLGVSPFYSLDSLKAWLKSREEKGRGRRR